MYVIFGTLLTVPKNLSSSLRKRISLQQLSNFPTIVYPVSNNPLDNLMDLLFAKTIHHPVPFFIFE